MTNVIFTFFMILKLGLKIFVTIFNSLIIIPIRTITVFYIGKNFTFLLDKKFCLKNSHKKLC